MAELMTALPGIVRLLAMLATLAFAPGTGIAQESEGKGPFVYKPPVTAEETPRFREPATAGAAPTNALEIDPSPELRRRLATEAYAHQEWVFRHQRRTFGWQLWTSGAIFALVVLMTLAGLFFSWLQFRAARYGEAGASDGLRSDLKVSGKGIEISSPVLGVIILTLSMGFFYLFVLHVYPIEKVDTLPAGAAIEAGVG